MAECAELHAVAQGATRDAAAANLREVVALALDGEDLAPWAWRPRRSSPSPLS